MQQGEIIISQLVEFTGDGGDVDHFQILPVCLNLSNISNILNISLLFFK